MCLTWLVATCTAAAVVYPLTRALERNSVMKPSWKKLMTTYVVRRGWQAAQ